MKRILGWTSRKSFLSLGLLLIAAVCVGLTLSRAQRPDHQAARLAGMVSHDATTQPDAATKARLNQAYGQLPLSFEANAGQTDPHVDFISRGSGYTLFLTPREAVLSLRAVSASPMTADAQDDRESAAKAILRMKFVGSEAKPRVTAQEELPGKVNYLLGNDPSQWRTGISTYAKVAYQNLYPGVDLVYYGNQQQLEYDFVVHPGTDPNIIAINFEGADGLKVDAEGELVLHVGAGEIRQRKPLIYQEVDGVRREVAGSYKLKDNNTVGFQLAEYDTRRPLVIDPVLVYSTFLGGERNDQGRDIALDASGNAYVTGFIDSFDFPTTVGAFDTTQDGNGDVFVTKLNPSGSALVYSTFLGGGGSDFGLGIAVDTSGSAYVTGETSSSNFPTTIGAFDTTHNGSFDVFVTKLNPSGSTLVYSTFVGGLSLDQATDIALDASGSAYITGQTFSSDFPTTIGAFDTTFNSEIDVFVTKLNPSGSAPLVYSTFLGGNSSDAGLGIALDSSGNAYVTGFTFSTNFPTTVGAFDVTHNGAFDGFVRSDAFVTKLNLSGSALVYSTFLGGTSTDVGLGIAVETSGSAYVTGDTASSDFPTTVGAFDTTYNGEGDVFVTKLNPSGAAPLVYSTFLGGSDNDTGRGIALDTFGTAYVTGRTRSFDFPTTVDAVDTTYNGEGDVFVTKLNPSGSAPLVYSTFLGGSDNDFAFDIAVDTFGSAYVTGDTASPNFPTTVGAFDTTHNGATSIDAFVFKLSPTSGVPATLTLNPSTATNTVDSQHCVTATVQDASGNAVANVVVRFQVSGAVETSGSATSDSSGEATFCYVGPPLPGADAITAFADTNNNNVQDPGEPSSVAEKTWVVPASTALCEITNGGWIIAANGDRATFGGNAKANESGQVQGQQVFQDHGPVQPLKLHSLNILAVVCDGTTRASIFGQATIDGSGVVNFRINVQDLGGPGKGQDTYWLLLDGYNSGEQILGGGNIQIRRR